MTHRQLVSMSADARCRLQESISGEARRMLVDVIYIVVVASGGLSPSWKVALITSFIADECRRTVQA